MKRCKFVAIDWSKPKGRIIADTVCNGLAQARVLSPVALSWSSEMHMWWGYDDKEHIEYGVHEITIPKYLKRGCRA